MKSIKCPHCHGNLSFWYLYFFGSATCKHCALKVRFKEPLWLRCFNAIVFGCGLIALNLNYPHLHYIAKIATAFLGWTIAYNILYPYIVNKYLQVEKPSHNGNRAK